MTSNLEKKITRRSFLIKVFQFVLNDCIEDDILRNYNKYQTDLRAFSFQSHYIPSQEIILDKVKCLGSLILFANSKGKTCLERSIETKICFKNHLMIKNGLIKMKNKFYKKYKNAQILFLIINKCFEMRKNNKCNIRFFRELLPEIEKSFNELKQYLQLEYQKKITNVKKYPYISKPVKEEFSFKKQIEVKNKSKSSESRSTSEVKIKKKENLNSNVFKDNSNDLHSVSPVFIDYLKRNCFKSKSPNLKSRKTCRSISRFVSQIQSKNNSLSSSSSQVSIRSLNFNTKTIKGRKNTISSQVPSFKANSTFSEDFKQRLKRFSKSQRGSKKQLLKFK